MVSGLLCACGRPMSDGAKVCKECRMGANRTIPRVCEQCGVTFLRRAHSRDSGRFCGRKCTGDHKRDVAAAKRAARPPKPIRRCAQCAKEIGRGKYCSPDCYVMGSGLRKRLTCEECGVRLGPHKSRNCAKCSPSACRRRANFAAKARPGYREQKRINKQRRKARQRGVYAELVNPLVVLARDGWRCQLCGCATPRKLRGTISPNAPELDHIVPLAQGGPHTYANTQCACRRCNLDKSDTIKGQLRLAI